MNMNDDDDELRITAFGRTVLLKLGPYLKSRQGLKQELTRQAHNLFSNQMFQINNEWRRIEETKMKMYELAMEDERLWNAMQENLSVKSDES